MTSRTEVEGGLEICAGERPLRVRPHNGRCAYLIGTTAAIVAGSIAAGGSIASAAIQSRAAGKAAKQQAQGAQQATELLGEASEKAATGVEGATEEAVGGLREATQTAIGGVERAREQGQQVIGDVHGTGQQTLKDVYEAGGVNIAPFLDLGKGTTIQLAGLLAPGGEFNRRFSMEDYQADPGYEFRLAEGQKALERSAAARGRVLGGGTLKALSRYSQGVASDEYQRAFERFQAENAARFGRLAAASGMGLTAVGEQNALGKWYGTNTTDLGKWYGSTALGNLMLSAKLRGDYGVGGATDVGRFLMGGAEDAGGFRMRGAEGSAGALAGAANAQAAGTVGSGNAWAQGIGGASNAFMNAILLSQLMQPRPDVVRPDVVRV